MRIHLPNTVVKPASQNHVRVLQFMLALLIANTSPAFAWGDQGHEMVALIADHYLKPVVRTKVKAILSGDATHLTPDTGTASEATWADKFRDSDRNTTKIHYDQTHNWHFVDIELDGPDIDAACFNHPVVPAGTVASESAAEDCVVDKIDEFAAELKDAATPADEKRMALQFLLHFVGDVHQPLHSSDDHDAGGNQKEVKADGADANSLHHYWDTEFVLRIGSDPKKAAQRIIASITPGQLKTWKKGDTSAWAMESYTASTLWTYRGLGAPDSAGKYTLSTTYVRNATNIASRQLARAGVRLSVLLNSALQ
jgi:hypothetical protein